MPTIFMIFIEIRHLFIILFTSKLYILQNTLMPVYLKILFSPRNTKKLASRKICYNAKL